MGKIWPESVSAIGRVHAAEAVLVAADAHFPGIRAVFLDRIPFAVFPGAAADRLDFAVVFFSWARFIAAATPTLKTNPPLAKNKAKKQKIYKQQIADLQRSGAARNMGRRTCVGFRQSAGPTDALSLH